MEQDIYFSFVNVMKYLRVDKKTEKAKSYRFPIGMPCQWSAIWNCLT